MATMATMDHVVAQSLALRASNRPPGTLSSAVDDIPMLTRALSQIHTDSTRLLSSRTALASPTASVHASALRLFATLEFDLDQLRRNVARLDGAASFVETPERPLPPFRHPFWLAPRAADDSRLVLNASLCAAADDAMKADVIVARDALVSALSTLYPTPRATTPIPVGRTSSAGRLTPQPSTSRSRRPRSPRSEGMTPPPVAAVPLPKPYVDAVSAIATHGHASSAPLLLLEAAAETNDVPQFTHSLDIVARIARHSNPNQSPPPDLPVWAARTVLEDQYATRIPEMPEKPRTAPPRDVVAAVERFVDAQFAHPQYTLPGRAIAGMNIDDDDSSGPRQPLRPSAWMCVFICLRVGAVAAARLLLERTSLIPAQFFSWFEEGQRLVRCTFASLSNSSAEPATSDSNMRNADGPSDAATGEDSSEDRQNSVPALDRNIPMVPGCLTSERQYEEVAKEYRATASSSEDPFMRACYVLLMRLDLSSPAAVVTDGVQHTGDGFSRRSTTAGGKHERFSLFLSDADFDAVFPTVEDYLWLRLWLCRTSCEERILQQLPHSSFLLLHDVQAEVLSCGDMHFNPDGTQPLLFAFVLAATLQMDRAVSYLYEHTDEHWLHYAIHLALSLYHARWPEIRESVMEHMLGRYCDRLAQRSVADATLYALTIRSKEAVQKLLGTLITQCGDVDTMLGRVADDGTVRHVGTLPALVPEDATVPSGFSQADVHQLRKTVAHELAVAAVKRREFSRAAELFAIAERIVDVADMRMRNVVAEVHRLCSKRRAPALIAARDILDDYKKNIGMDEDSKDESEWSSNPTTFKAQALQVALDMAPVFEDYWTGRYAAAWQRLRDVKVVPMSASEMASARRVTEDLATATRDLEKRSSSGPPDCIVEILKVALHVADYALESHAVRNGDRHEPLGEDMNRPIDFRSRQDDVLAIPSIREIKSVSAFAALLQTGDPTIEQRLVRIEAFITEGNSYS